MPTPSMPDPPLLPEPRRVGSSDGVELAVYDFGGTGRDALLAHANGFCAGVMAPLARELGPWHCVAFDSRAHGRSSSPEGSMAWEGHRDDVLAVLDHTGLDRPVGIGHSMGGAALLLAEQHRPGTFAALWLFEPIVFPPMAELPPGENPLAAGAARRRVRFDGKEAAYANFAGKPPLDELSPECLAAYVEHGFAPTEDDAVVLRCSPEAEAEGYRMGTRHGAWDALGSIRCPVVVARGAETEPGPASMAPMVADRLPHGRLEEHPELGHFGPLADPAGVARSVRAVVEQG
jgi:pimeloyl-ACP methyl ester carboxylesterase